MTWAANEASDRAAKAEKELKARDASILSLKDLLSAAEAKAAKAEADMGELQASSRALRLRDANDAVDVGAYNILAGRIEVLEAAEGGVVGKWRLEEVKAEMNKWYPEEAGVPGTKFLEFLEEHKGEEENEDAGDERTASTGSGTA